MERKSYMQSDIKENWFSQYNKNTCLVVDIEFCSASSPVGSNSHNLHICKGNVFCRLCWCALVV